MLCLHQNKLRETEEANKRVSAALDSSIAGKKRKPERHSEETRAKIGKYAAQNGVAAARRHFKDKMGDLPESTVRKYKNLYTTELSARSKKNDTSEITALPMKKRGRPSALGEIIDQDVQKYIRALRQAGAPVSAQLIRAAAEGIVSAKDRNLLIENGGHVSLTRGWAISILQRMGYIKRKATTKTSVFSNSEFQAKKGTFLSEVSGMVTAHKIPNQLILNWDQTGLQLVPSGNWTLEERGTRRVELTGLNDKRMITATFTCSLSGRFLPMQLLYTGKTSRCHPQFSGFPPEFDIWHSPNHWANQETTIRFINNVILPYINKTRQEMSLRSDYPALAIFDVFRGQTVDDVYALLENNHIYVVKVPSNCTAIRSIGQQAHVRFHETSFILGMPTR